MSIINERLKLAANALNTLATASITVGVLAPAAAIFYGLGSLNLPRPLWHLIFGALIWVSIGAALHYGAQKLLGRLRP